ncbi:YciI family protein [Kribbella sp. NPDC051587]|uniref:YciI family protein n=1 Tax=Kribbella sp. NPDC051587 TaxID=3364119 RepID=UPI0037999392
MNYLVLIFGDEAEWAATGPEERARIVAAHEEFAAKAGDAVLTAGELELSSTATSLRSGGNGQVTITDAPFLEAKEVLGGFYVLQAEDLDQVIALASGLREVHVGHSGVEIRPLVNHG